MSTLNTITTSTSSTTHFDGKLAVGDYDPYMSLDSALPGPEATSQTLPVPYSKDAKPSTIEQEPTFLPSPSYLPPPPLPPPSSSNENNPSWYHGSKNTETTVPENELDSSFNNTSVAVNESSNAAGNPAWYHGDNTLTSLKDGIVSGPDTAFGSRIQRERTNSQESRDLLLVQNDSEPEIKIREVSSRMEHVPKRSSVNMSDEPTVTITSVTIEKRNENGDVMKAKVIENGQRMDGGRFDEELWEQDIMSPVTRYDSFNRTEVVNEKIDQSNEDEEEKLSHSGKKVKKADQEKRGSKKVETKKKTKKDSDDSVEDSDDDEEEEDGKKKKVVKSKETRKEDDDSGKKVVKTEKKKTKDSDDDSDDDDDSSEISSDTDDGEKKVVEKTERKKTKDSDDDSDISNDIDDSDEEKPKKKKVVKEEGNNTEKTKVEKKSSTGSASKKSAGGAKSTEKKETSVTTKPADSSSAPKKDYPPLIGSDDEASTSDNEDKGKREKLKEKVKECIIS